MEKEKRQPDEGAGDAPIRVDMSVAQISFVRNDIRVDIELPVRKVIEHAVEGSIQWPVHSDFAQDDAIIEDHEG
jgi:hypothetical protein